MTGENTSIEEIAVSSVAETAKSEAAAETFAEAAIEAADKAEMSANLAIASMEVTANEFEIYASGVKEKFDALDGRLAIIENYIAEKETKSEAEPEPEPEPKPEQEAETIIENAIETPREVEKTFIKKRKFNKL